MQKIMLLCLALCLGFGLSAQHYKVGETYTFQSEGISYQVRYNKEGVASIKKGATEDKTSKSYIFTNLDYFNNFSADDAATANATGSNYWVIPFTKGEAKAIEVEPKTSLSFSCSCQKGDGPCNPSWTILRYTATIACVSDAGCSTCSLSEGKIGENTYTTGVLMIEATKVVFE